MRALFVTLDLELAFDSGLEVSLQGIESVKQLVATGTPVTVFVEGQFALRFPTLVRELYDVGCEIAAHCFDHRLGPDRKEDIVKTRDILYRIVGEYPRGYRAYAFSYSDELQDWLGDLGFEWDSSKCTSFLSALRSRKKLVGSKKRKNKTPLQYPLGSFWLGIFPESIPYLYLLRRPRPSYFRISRKSYCFLAFHLCDIAKPRVSVWQTNLPLIFKIGYFLFWKKNEEKQLIDGLFALIEYSDRTPLTISTYFDEWSEVR